MRLRVGDTVVYSTHGVGRVVRREHTVVLGVERDCVVLDLADGLRVTLGVDQARERLRAVATAVELDRVEQTLGEPAQEFDGPWMKRMRAGKEKLVSGQAVELAEIVRDGVRRGDATAAGGVRRLSPGERQLYMKARQLLTREICSARGIGEEAATAWIDAQAGCVPVAAE